MSDLYVEDKYIVEQKYYEHAVRINGYVDYVVHVDCRMYSDNTTSFDIEDELVVIFDDKGQALDSLSVTLPSEYVQVALVAAREEFE